MIEMPIRAAVASLGGLLAALLLPGAALAGACTVGTSAAVCVAANTAKGYRLVAIDNESATAKIACTDDGSTPAVGAAGSYTIQPLATRLWGTANVTFFGAFTCISDTAASPVTYTAQ